MFDFGDIVSMIYSLSVAHTVMNEKENKVSHYVIDKLPFKKNNIKKWLKTIGDVDVRLNTNYYIKNLYHK